MGTIVRLAWASLLDRKFATILTISSLALSVALLFGIERMRRGARDSFANTISQTDLIVGAKGGSLQLLLYSVFRIGSPTDNVSYQTYQEIASRPDVAWSIPYSLGDSHRGYRVVGTNQSFYDHYRYRRNNKIEFADGRSPQQLFEVVVGSEVAATLKYKVGDRLTLSHGVSVVSFQDHEDKPFRISGVLARTATPIDRSLYVSLEAIEAIHADWVDGAPPLPGAEITVDDLVSRNLSVQQITAFLIGAKSRIAVLQLQRDINDYEEEAIMGIIPGVALSELWEGISYAESALRVVSLFVVLVGMIGMLVTIYNSLNERRREMAILRSIGAGAGTIFGLMVLEAVLLTLLGTVVGLSLMYILVWLSQGLIETQFGMFIPVSGLSGMEWLAVSVVILSGALLGLLPAWRAYRNSLADGLVVKV